MSIRILNLDYHRNGIGGVPFHAIVFRDSGPEGSVKLAVVFDSLNHIAVLDIVKLAECDIAFGSNSWRGDVFEDALRRAIGKHNRRIDAKINGQKGVGV